MKKRKVGIILGVVLCALLAVGCTGYRMSNLQEDEEIAPMAVSDYVDEGIDSTRNMSSREAFMLQISVGRDYFTEGKRPEKSLDVADKEGQLWCSVSDGQEQWIYPDREMTEEEILQILDYKYSNIDKAFYTPKEGQLTADNAEARTEELLQEYVPGLGKIDEIYVLYFENEPTPDGMVDCWKTYVHMKNSDHDYYVKFTADTGKLVELIQGEKNCFTEEYYLDAKLNGKTEVIAE